MVNYRSSTSRTVSMGRYQVTQDPGVDLESADPELDALVVSGQLIKDGGAPVAAPKSEESVTATPGKSK
jgi:hypothetical protein